MLADFQQSKLSSSSIAAVAALLPVYLRLRGKGQVLARMA